jgi:hypothetical protein
MPIAALVPTVRDGLDAPGIGLDGSRHGDAWGGVGRGCGKRQQQGDSGGGAGRGVHDDLFGLGKMLVN